MQLILLEVSVKVTQVYESLDLMLKDYFHATYSTGNISESDLSGDDSHSLQPKSYLHATYFAVDESWLGAKRLFPWYVFCWKYQ